MIKFWAIAAPLGIALSLGTDAIFNISNGGTAFLVGLAWGAVAGLVALRFANPL